jgi:DNA-binding NtrC family response regulator
LFPASEKAAEETSAPCRQVLNWQGAGTVLVVDDEESVRTIAKRMLQQFGFEVLLAKDGLEAVETFCRYPEEIATVLLDMTMPQMDGEAAYCEIRRVSPDVRVILMSGYNEQDATNRFAGKGLAGFVQKPFRLQELIGKVREVIES